MKLADLSHIELLAAVDLIDGDGHTIFPAEDFEQIMPHDIVSQFTMTYNSSADDPKYMITSNDTGQVVPSMRGVYGLDLLRGIASALGVRPSIALGRGTEARDLTARIRAHLATPTPNA